MDIVAGWNFRIVALIVVATLLVTTMIRRHRTRLWHVDYPARTDMVRLLATVLGGQIGELIRSRFQPGTAGFWIMSVVLLPFVAGALFYLYRLFDAYRSSAAPKLPSKPEQRSGRPPQI